MCSCVGVYSMYVGAYLLVLVLPSSEMQLPSKSQFRELLCFTHATLLHLHIEWLRCMGLILYQADSPISTIDMIEVPLSI